MASLAKSLRNGQYTGTIGKPESIVLVGHSFGSITSNNLIAKYPKLVDGAVLTAIAYAPVPDQRNLLIETAAPRIASNISPSQSIDLDTGYLTFADIYAHINAFFKGPNYEVDVAKYANTLVAPFAITEYIGPGASFLSPDFEGPVLVTSGEFDIAVCGGECYSTFEQQNLTALFPKSRLLEGYVHPGAGHGINFGKNATGFYTVITEFLDKSGF